MDQEKAHHTVRMLCRVLEVSTSGYYTWRTRGPSPWARRDETLMNHIRRIYQQSRGTYGAPRIHAELMRKGLSCSRKRVARLMRQHGLVGVHRRRRHGITRRNPLRLSAPDLVQRQFTPKAPNELWVADLTQHRSGEGWLYLAVVIDAFSRRVIGWAMGDRPTAELAISAVNMAVRNRRPRQPVIHHSDHGTQYTALAFGRTLRQAGLLSSMGRVGDALDNAVAESFFATLQTELLDRESWPTRSRLTSAIFEYIEAFYNLRRLHSTLDYLSPADYERRWSMHGRKSEATVA